VVWKYSGLLQINDMQNLFWVGLKESVHFRIVVMDRKVAFKLDHKKLA
jgi:hypothetical protein